MAVSRDLSCSPSMKDTFACMNTPPTIMWSPGVDSCVIDLKASPAWDFDFGEGPVSPVVSETPVPSPPARLLNSPPPAETSRDPVLTTTTPPKNSDDAGSVKSPDRDIYTTLQHLLTIKPPSPSEPCNGPVTNVNVVFVQKEGWWFTLIVPTEPLSVWKRNSCYRKAEYSIRVPGKTAPRNLGENTI